MPVQCPNCKQRKLYSRGEFSRLVGVIMGPIGLFLIWIPFIGLPLLIFGAALFVASFIPGAHNRYMCLNCHYND